VCDLETSRIGAPYIYIYIYIYDISNLRVKTAPSITNKCNWAKIPGLLRYLGFFKRGSVTSSFNGGGGAVPFPFYISLFLNVHSIDPSLTEQN